MAKTNLFLLFSLKHTPPSVNPKLTQQQEILYPPTTPKLTPSKAYHIQNFMLAHKS